MEVTGPFNQQDMVGSSEEFGFRPRFLRHWPSLFATGTSVDFVTMGIAEKAFLGAVDRDPQHPTTMWNIVEHADGVS